MLKNGATFEGGTVEFRGYSPATVSVESGSTLHSLDIAIRWAAVIRIFGSGSRWTADGRFWNSSNASLALRIDAGGSLLTDSATLGRAYDMDLRVSGVGLVVRNDRRACRRRILPLVAARCDVQGD